jgi:bifunctional non-homologous end joining protein LigD
MTSHLDKLYWKKEKITKGDLLAYYRSVAKKMLPYLKGRPLVMHRFPSGVDGEHFYQKQAPAHLPAFVHTTTVQHKERKITYIVVDNLKTLLYVVNLGCIEFHPFHAKVGRLDRPDYWILDLDPQNIPFAQTVRVAQEVHAVLQEKKMKSFCKTSGSRGLHIYVPVRGKSFAQTKALARAVAEEVHRRLPKITSLQRLPKKRKGKVYIDYLQNASMQTVVAAYSVRGKPGAPISMPLAWSQVKLGLNPRQYTLQKKRVG